MDKLEAMAVFSSVAEQRSFAAAARKHGLSASSVTRIVAALEARLGARLLQRTTRSVTTTDAGARYLERAKAILAAVADADGAAEAERHEPSGRFALTAPSLFGRLHVAPVMGELLRRHRAVLGELTLSDRAANLVEEGIDAAVRIGDLADSSLVARVVGATRRVVVASPEYLARSRKLITPASLTDHELIQFTAITPTSDWQFQHEARARRVSVRPRYVTNSADAAIDHAERGGGLTMALAYQVMNAVRGGRLRVVLARFEPPPLPIHIVYPSTKLLSAKVRAFIELVTTTCDWRFVELRRRPATRS